MSELHGDLGVTRRGLSFRPAQAGELGAGGLRVSEAAGGLLEQLGGAAVGQPGPAGDRAQVGGGHRADGFAAGEEYRPAAARPSIVRSRMRSRGLCRDGANAVRMCRLISRMCPSSDAPHARGRADWRTGPAIWADPQGVLAVL